MRIKQLKIAIVSDAIYPYNKGGKEKRIFEISRRLVKKGYEVTIYTMKWWKGNKKDMLENGVHLKAISPLYPLYSGRRRSIKEAIFFSIHCLMLLRQDFDVIDVDHMPHLVLFAVKAVCLLKRKKMIVTWNEVWGREYWNEYLGRLGNIAFIVEWVSSKLPDEIISVSQHTKRKLISELKVKQKIHVVPNGIAYEDIQKIKPSREKSDIIFAGRLLAHKNADFLLTIVSKIKKSFPNIRALVIGDGPEKSKLKTMIDDLKIKKNVKMIGFLENHNDLYALMKSSRVFIFPSTREGFGIVALEANACGIPFITTNHQDNATKDLISSSKNGYAVSFEESAFYKKIMICLLSKKTSQIYARIARDYDWGKLTEKIEEVYTK